MSNNLNQKEQRIITFSNKLPAVYAGMIDIREHGKYRGYFSIHWDGSRTKLERITDIIPEAKWSRPSIVVHTRFISEVIKFAKKYKFRFTKKSLEAMKIMNV